MVAWMAAREGHAVTLFEAESLGGGASGRALGVLVPVTGLDRPIDKLQREGIGKWPGIARQLAADSGSGGGNFWRAWGNERQQVRIPLIFEILRAAIEKHGGQVREGKPVEDVAALRRGFDMAVLAAGWGNAILGGQPMKLSAGLALRLAGRVDGLVCGDNLFVVPDWNDTVLAGSLNWDVAVPGDGAAPEGKVEELRARVGRLVPGLAGAEVIERWVGYRPVQAPRLPLVRPVADGVWAVAGLGKTGFALAPLLWDALRPT